MTEKYLHKEKEPIQRHSFEYFVNNEKIINNDIPTCFFVVNCDLSTNNILLFSSKEQSLYINNLDFNIRTIF